MSRRMLNDRQWLQIADLLPGKPTDKGDRAADNRRFSVRFFPFRELTTFIADQSTLLPVKLQINS